MTTQTGRAPGGPDPADADLGFELAKPARWSPGRVIAGVVVVVLAFGGLFAFSYLPRRAAQNELEKAAAERGTRLPRVAVVSPRLISNERVLTLAGSVQPLEEAVIYARASGYIRTWLVDIGAHVEQGALLAEIDTPELDQGLAQARAALAQAQANVLQAKANQGLAISRLDRTGKLVDAGLSPEQDLEQSQAQSVVGEADISVALANVAAQRANIQRLTELRDYSHVTAPFAGTITERNIDRGSLVTAGSATNPLFKLASTDTVRVFIQVPQDAAPSIKVGSEAKLHVREFPNADFKGQIARTAGALDPATRTLSTEIRVANPEGRLLAGMYADVKLTLASARQVFELPATVLMNDAAGLRIAFVRGDGTVHLQPVLLERDLGATVQVATGLDGTERVVQLAGPELVEGQRVEAVAGTSLPSSSTTVAPSKPAPSASAAPR